MKIYTRTGDKGETGLYGGKRISKASLRVNAYGTVDELNSNIGVVVAGLRIIRTKKELEQIQNDLFDIGSLLATPSDVQVTKGQQLHKELPKYLRSRVDTLEKAIDSYTAKISPMTAFILPGGSIAGAQLHVARTICRRAERLVIELAKKETVSAEVIMYFNRLSDFLFTVSRFINKKEKKKETLWKSSVE